MAQARIRDKHIYSVTWESPSKNNRIAYLCLDCLSKEKTNNPKTKYLATRMRYKVQSCDQCNSTNRNILKLTNHVKDGYRGKNRH